MFQPFANTLYFPSFSIFYDLVFVNNLVARDLFHDLKETSSMYLRMHWRLSTILKTSKKVYELILLDM